MVWTSWLVCSLSRNCTKDSSFLICFVWRENLHEVLVQYNWKEKNALIKFSLKCLQKIKCFYVDETNCLKSWKTLGLLSINDWNIKIEEEGYNLSDFDQ